MELKLEVLIPLVCVLSSLVLIGIVILCRLYYVNFWNKKKHNYSKLDTQRISKSQPSATIRPTTPPHFSFYQEQQSSRIQDPPVFGKDSFNSPTKESQFEYSAATFKNFNPAHEAGGINDLFNYDDSRSFKSSGSEYEGDSNIGDSVQSERFVGKPMKLSKQLKTRYRSEPTLNTSHQEKSSFHETKWKRFTKNRSKTKYISVTVPAAGKLEFTLFYDPDDRSLVISIIQLMNIVLKPESFIGILEIQNRSRERKIGTMHLIRNSDDTLELGGLSETGYSVYLTLSPKKSFIKHTETIFCEGHALFNEKFTIHGQAIEQLSKSYLCLHVLCKFGRDCEPIVLGEIKVPLKRLQVGQLLPFIANMAKPEDEVVLEGSLKPATDLGFLEVYLSYNPMAQTLVVRIIQGTGLPKIGMTGHPNISVKTSLYYCNLRTSKRTTSIQKRQRNPVFNETFEFQLSKDRIAECDVLFEIRHHGPMHRTVIGYVIVGQSAGGEGSKQWKQLLDFSYQEQKYEILPNRPVGLN